MIYIHSIPGEAWLLINTVVLIVVENAVEMKVELIEAAHVRYDRPHKPSQRSTMASTGGIDRISPILV